ncbi:MAG: galactokinase [Planctomycetota bacterium]|nr:galactokinase [Planctomycetota bacterium]
MTSATDRQQQVAEVFQRRFGTMPQLWARAPGRVDLMGSHTDYNLGYVLTLPIGRDTWIAARPRVDRHVRLYTLNLDAESTFDLDQLVPAADPRWSNYVRGVAAELQIAGYELCGFDGVIHSTVPISSGLSSSAALECVTAVVFQALAGWTLDPVKMAQLCQRAENRFVGVHCGILDQYTSCVGRAGCALLLDCRDLSSRPVLLAAGLQVVICDTRSKRELSGSEYGLRRAQCEQGAQLLGVRALREVSLAQFEQAVDCLPAEVAKRCRFIVEENARVLALADALVAGQRAAIRRLMADSFRGASELYEIGAPAMDAMLDAMGNAPGVIGARQAGAGFGGCLVALVEQPQVDAFTQAVQEVYFRATQIQPEVFAVEAAAGAGLLS